MAPDARRHPHRVPQPKQRCPVDGRCPAINDPRHQVQYRHTCTFRPCPYVHTFPSHRVLFIHEGEEGVGVGGAYGSPERREAPGFSNLPYDVEAARGQAAPVRTLMMSPRIGTDGVTGGQPPRGNARRRSPLPPSGEMGRTPPEQQQQQQARPSRSPHDDDAVYHHGDTRHRSPERSPRGSTVGDSMIYAAAAAGSGGGGGPASDRSSREEIETLRAELARQRDEHRAMQQQLHELSASSQTPRPWAAGVPATTAGTPSRHITTPPAPRGRDTASDPPIHQRAPAAHTAHQHNQHPHPAQDHDHVVLVDNPSSPADDGHGYGPPHHIHTDPVVYVYNEVGLGPEDSTTLSLPSPARPQGLGGRGGGGGAAPGTDRGYPHPGAYDAYGGGSVVVVAAEPAPTPDETTSPPRPQDTPTRGLGLHASDLSIQNTSGVLGAGEVGSPPRGGDAGPVVIGATCAGRTCVHCNQRVPHNASFCIHCGKSLKVPLSRQACYSCHAQLSSRSLYCTRCGARRRDPSEARARAGVDAAMVWCPACPHLGLPDPDGNCEACGAALNIGTISASPARSNRY